MPIEDAATGRAVVTYYPVTEPSYGYWGEVPAEVVSDERETMRVKILGWRGRTLFWHDPTSDGAGSVVRGGHVYDGDGMLVGVDCEIEMVDD